MPFLKDGTHVYEPITEEQVKQFKEKWKGKTMAQMMDETEPGWRKRYNKKLIEYFEKEPAAQTL